MSSIVSPKRHPKLQNLLRVKQSVWSCKWLTALFWEQHPCLNKLDNFPQQIARWGGVDPSRTKTMVVLLSATSPETRLTSAAPDHHGQSLIQHHAMLTGSPRLWGGSGAAAPTRRKRETSFLRGSWEANGQPKQREQVKPGQSGIRPETRWLQAAGSLAVGMAGLGQQ